MKGYGGNGDYNCERMTLNVTLIKPLYHGSVLTLKEEDEQMEIPVEITGASQDKSSKYFYLLIEPISDEARFKVSW